MTGQLHNPSQRPAKRLASLKQRRRWWLQVHLWLGLFAGAMLLVVGLTGSVITFWQELDAVLNPVLHQIAAPPAGEGAYRPADDWLAAADAAMPNHAKRGYIYYPRHAQQAVWIFYDEPTGQPGKNHVWNVFVNPYTAKVTGTRLWEHADNLFQSCFMDVVFKLHYALLLDWDDGSWIVGSVALLALISVLSGLILWWPLTGHWLKALSIKPNASAERFNYDLHKTLGFYSCLILLGVLVSGVYFNFGDQFRWLVDQFSPTIVLDDFRSIPKAGILPLAPEQALAIADKALPEGRWYWWKFPETAADSYIFTKNVDFGGLFRGRQQIVIDQYSGQILHIAEPLSGGAGNVFLQWQWPLHSGQFLRLPGRILVLLSGLACPALFVTGIIRWLQKQRVANLKKSSGL